MRRSSRSSLATNVVNVEVRTAAVGMVESDLGKASPWRRFERECDS